MNLATEQNRRERVQRVIDSLIHPDKQHREAFTIAFDKFMDKWENNYQRTNEGVIRCAPSEKFYANK